MQNALFASTGCLSDSVSPYLLVNNSTGSQREERAEQLDSHSCLFSLSIDSGFVAGDVLGRQLYGARTDDALAYDASYHSDGRS